MQPMLNIAVRAARAAGKIILQGYSQLDRVEKQAKGVNDLVTSVDKASEQVIIETLLKAYPDHGVIAEESGIGGNAKSDYQWIIDPLDGTVNFARGIPHFCVSIALKHKDRIEQAVIYDPIREELFTASRGAGAQLNGYRIRVGNALDLNGCIFLTAFPFKSRQHLPAYMNIFESVFSKVADVRRAGSAALDLAYVATGRADAYLEAAIKPWDIAAGELIVVEAGGLVSDFAGGHNHLASGNVVAANPKVMRDLLTTIKPHLGTALAR